MVRGLVIAQKYEIIVRGQVPDGLRESISGIHAFAILRNNGLKSSNKMSDLETQNATTAIDSPTSPMVQE